MGSRVRLAVVLRLNRDVTPEEHDELRREFAAQVAADPPKAADFQLPERLQALGLAVQDVEFTFDVPLQRRSVHLQGAACDVPARAYTCGEDDIGFEGGPH